MGRVQTCQGQSQPAAASTGMDRRQTRRATATSGPEPTHAWAICQPDPAQMCNRDCNSLAWEIHSAVFMVVTSQAFMLGFLEYFMLQVQINSSELLRSVNIYNAHLETSGNDGVCLVRGSEEEAPLPKWESNYDRCHSFRIIHCTQLRVCVCVCL